MKSTLVETGYVAGWKGVRLLPEPAARAAFGLIADQAWRRRGTGVRQLEANLQRVVPDASPSDLRDLSRQAMRSYLRYWCETFRLPTWDRDELVGRMVVHNRERIFEYRSRGRGLIAVLGHFGNWDHCGAWATTVGLPLITVAERLKPESLFDRFVSYRESLGIEVLPLTGGGHVSQILRERLAEDAFVCLLSDRDLSPGGVDVELLGEPARLPAGPALLAARTGATLMPTVSYYSEGFTHVEFLPELVPPAGASLREQVQVLTQQFADIVGETARAHPTDWHMLQPVWTADRAAS